MKRTLAVLVMVGLAAAGRGALKRRPDDTLEDHLGDLIGRVAKALPRPRAGKPRLALAGLTDRRSGATVPPALGLRLVIAAALARAGVELDDDAEMRLRVTFEQKAGGKFDEASVLVRAVVAGKGGPIKVLEATWALGRKERARLFGGVVDYGATGPGKGPYRASDGAVYASEKSPYGVQLRVFGARANRHEPVMPALKGEQARATLPPGATYSVLLRNNSAADVVAYIRVDGLPFSRFLGKGELPLVVKARSVLLVRGFPAAANKGVITRWLPFRAGAWPGAMGRPSVPAGGVTVEFHVTSAKRASPPPPADEPRVRVDPGRTVCPGRDIGDKALVVRRVIGRALAVVSVAYDTRKGR